MTVVNGFMFIIPNLSFTLGDDIAESTKDSIRRSLTNIGIEVADDEELVQLWYHNEACDNWCCHQWKEFPQFFGANGLPEHLPLRMLEGITEGDILKMPFVGGISIQVRAAQLEGRYARFGRFEDVLLKVLRK